MTAARTPPAQVSKGEWPSVAAQAQSIGVGYLFHCLPGPIATKVRARARASAYPHSEKVCMTIFDMT